MHTNVVLRNIPVSEKLVRYARERCAELDAYLHPTQTCELLLQSLGTSTDVIACLVLGGRSSVAFQHLSSDPFHAVDGVTEMVLGWLREKNGAPGSKRYAAGVDGMPSVPMTEAS